MGRVRVTVEELRWREWHLGRETFRRYGPRNPDARHLTGAPARIPDEWWERFEAFLARTDLEPSRTVPAGRKIAARFPHRRADGSEAISDHFRIHEFNCKNGQVVPRIAVPALIRLAELFLEPLRGEFGPVLVMSGYRPAAYNASIGGARYSQHIYELTPDSVAADVIPRTGNPGEWARFLRELARRHGGGVGDYLRSGFVHVDNGPRRDWSG